MSNASRIPKIYQPGGGPLRWQDDVTDILPAVVESFIDERLGRATCSPWQVELVRDYLEYYVNAPYWQLGPEDEAYYQDFMAVRERVKTLKTAEEIDEWIRDVHNLGIDPL